MPYRDSDSDNSSSSHYRRKKKARSRSSSSSSEERYRHSKRTSRRRRHRSRSSSRHSSRRTSRRRRSRSSSRYRRSRSRSSSPRRRPRSRSPKHRSHKSSSRRQSASSSSSPSRRSSSPSPSKSTKYSAAETIPRNVSDADRLRMKIQQVIRAAATANAELREKGLLSGEETAQLRLAAPSVSEQLERAKIIDEINAPSFTQQSFVSRRKDEKKDSSKDTDNHDAAIFGSLECLASATKEVVPLCNWREKPELLVHENLLESVESKLDRWRKKLSAERRKRLNGVSLGHLARADV